MRIQHENIIIDSNIPISHLFTLDLHHQLDEHGTLKMNVQIKQAAQTDFLQTTYLAQPIRLFTTVVSVDTLLFSGEIQSVTYEKAKDVITATIEATSYSIALDRAKKFRSFQDTTLRFRSLLNQITPHYQARFNWQVGNDRPVAKPFIQYQETDWAFIKRLASYFEQPIHANLLSETPDFYFGVRAGIRRTIGEVTLSERGMRKDYYENKGYIKGTNRQHYQYLKIRHREPWQVGDFADYQNQRLTVIETQAIFKQGELTFRHTLGAAGYLERKKIVAKHLIGLNLQGTIRRIEKESIAIQLEIDQEEQPHYLWKWTPEIGNLGYVMPEMNSKVVLTFSTHDELDGLATHLLRTDPNSSVFKRHLNRGLVTAADKTLGLQPDQILIAGANQEVNITVAPQAGICLKSHTHIQMSACGKMVLKGSQATISAPHQLLMQTNRANIDVANHFNLFAPSGVGTSSQHQQEPPSSRGAVGMTGSTTPDVMNCALGALPSLSNVKQMDPHAFAATSTRGALPSLTGGGLSTVTNRTNKGKGHQVNQRVFENLASYSGRGGSKVPRRRIE